MLTRWGRTLDSDAAHPEHPRPQLVRPDWRSLHGVWECAIAPTGERPHVWQPIVVPFSPESELSGVRRQLQPHETLHYRREFDLPADFPGSHRVVLHLDAVDQRCHVRVNGTPVGRGECGYLPVDCDITHAVRRHGNTLEVTVTDPSETGQGMRGKQRLERGGIWYTATSGIWQPVWIEAVPDPAIQHVEATTVRVDDGWGLDVRVDPDGSARSTTPVRVEVLADNTVVAEGSAVLSGRVRIPLPDPRWWSPTDPFLYDLRVTLGEDQVTSYAALRTVGIDRDAAGTPRLTLNGEPFLHTGVLDQGYWPDGLLTPPSDAAMVADIETVKRLGFTTIRKHVTVEPRRWYHHCDRLGVLVWQDLPNGGGPYVGRAIDGRNRVPERPRRLHGRADAPGRARFEEHAEEIVRQLRCVPSIVLWTVFNEGWGQFDTVQVGALVSRADPTRPVVHASGWHDRGGGDVATHHEYLSEWRMPERAEGDDRVHALGEYGGVGLPVPGHTWGDAPWGYADAISSTDLTDRLVRMLREQVAPSVPAGLSAVIWTQLTDVEDEHNGLLTWDREVLKVDEAAVRDALTAVHREL
ncbi:hypothetical protein KLP28_11710 [Nocardioidaceae bacterium]|nr:hypothetical protein KLP28_11710 [Nocardioidaceae bacterium]